jgi:hypothetical protein
MKKNVFTEAYLNLLKNGHCKGVYQNDDGSVCILGALGSGHRLSIGEDGSFPWWESAVETLNVLAETVSITAWNDSPQTTQQEVLALLAQAESLMMSEDHG